LFIATVLSTAEGADNSTLEFALAWIISPW